jgi:hypothetical protein
MHTAETISGNDGPVIVRQRACCHMTIYGERHELFSIFYSHTRRVLSQEPETARRPSELSATAVTQKVWPLSLRLKDEFVMMFQTFECLEFRGKGHIHAPASRELEVTDSQTKPACRSKKDSVCRPFFDHAANLAEIAPGINRAANELI